MQTIKCLLLKNGTVLITEIIEVGSELGEPDCKLVNPFKVVDNKLQLWLDFTDQTELMIHSDSILTIVDPTPELHSEYNNNIK
mgnify:FL=1|tara:strand:- start:579 stop:827 length:249 start_codon:yes stop_codon:yes gene_type:complete